MLKRMNLQYLDDEIADVWHVVTICLRNDRCHQREKSFSLFNLAGSV